MKQWVVALEQQACAGVVSADVFTLSLIILCMQHLCTYSNGGTASTKATTESALASPQAAASSANVRLPNTEGRSYAKPDEHRVQSDVAHDAESYRSPTTAGLATATGDFGDSNSATADNNSTSNTSLTLAAAGTAQSPAHSDGRGVHRLFKAVTASTVTGSDAPRVTSLPRGQSTGNTPQGIAVAAANAVQSAVSSADEYSAAQVHNSDIIGESPMNDVAHTSSPRVHAASRPATNATTTATNSSTHSGVSHADLQCSVPPHALNMVAVTTSATTTAAAAASKRTAAQHQYESGTECLSSVLSSPTGFLAGCFSDTGGNDSNGNTTGGESLDGESLITLLQQQLQLPAEHSGHASAQQQQQQQQQQVGGSSALQRSATAANTVQQQQKQQQQHNADSSRSYGNVDSVERCLTSAATVAQLHPAAAAGAAAARVQSNASQRLQGQHSSSHTDTARNSPQHHANASMVKHSASSSGAADRFYSEDTALQHHRTVTFSDEDNDTAASSAARSAMHRSSSNSQPYARQAHGSRSSQQLQENDDAREYSVRDRESARTYSTQRQQQHYSGAVESSDEQYDADTPQYAAQHSAFSTSSSYRGGHPEERFNTALSLNQHSSTRIVSGTVTAGVGSSSATTNSARQQQQQQQQHIQRSSSNQKQAQYAVDSSDWLVDDPNDARGYSFADTHGTSSHQQAAAAEYNQQQQHSRSSSRRSNRRSGAAAVHFDSQQRDDSTAATPSSAQLRSSSSSRSSSALQQASGAHSTKRATAVTAAATGAATNASKRQRSTRSRSSAAATTTTVAAVAVGAQRQDSSGSLESVGSSLCSNYSGSDLCRGSGSADFETTLGFTRSIVVIKGNRDDLAGALLEASEAGNDDDVDLFSEDNVSLHSEQDDYYAQHQQQLEQQQQCYDETDADRVAVLAAAEQEFAASRSRITTKSVGSGSREEWLLQQQLDEQFELEQQQQQQQEQQELSYQDSSSSMPTYR
jgi:hypothetical protein